MMTTREEIEDNKILTSDFSAENIDNEFAGKIAKALMLNNSVKRLNFKGSNLSDSEFSIIADALIKRSKTLEVVNIDNTNVTISSISIIQNLIEDEITKNYFNVRHRRC